MLSKIYISFELIPFFVLLLLTLPIRFLLGLFASILIHECFHLAALRVCDVKIYRIYFRITGAEISTEPISCGKELICAAAGPIGSFLTVFLIRFFPVLSLCAIVHGMFNCMPLGTMDGGRVLYCGLRMILSLERANIVFKWIQRLTIFFLLVVLTHICVIYPVFLKYVPLALLVVLGKSPCKATRKRVQYL